MGTTETTEAGEHTWLPGADDKGRRIWTLQGSSYAVIRVSLELFYVMNLATGCFLTEFGEFSGLAAAQAAVIARPGRAGIYRQALELTREALAIPHPATLGDVEVHQQILGERIMHVLLMIGSVLDDRGPSQLGFTNAERATHAMEYCRGKLAENPPEGYRSLGQHVLR